jgi:hypothetical protein
MLKVNKLQNTTMNCRVNIEDEMNNLTTFAPQVFAMDDLHTDHRRNFLGTFAVLLLGGCATYPERYELRWTEEVQLHDGRVIPVRVKRKFVRLDRNRKFNNSIGKGTAVTFDAGPGVGEFVFEVDKNIAMIDQKDGTWYFLITSDLPQYVVLPPIMHSGLRLVHLEGKQIIGNRHSRELPKEFSELNLMHLTAWAVLAQYDGKYITLAEKAEYRIKHNTEISDRKIFLTQCAKESKC